MYKRQSICPAALVFLLLSAFGPGAARADLTLSLSVDTSSLKGQSGYLDIEFNPGDSSAEAATAIVTNFQTIGGILAQPPILTGDASGSLPGTLTLDNGTAYNDVFQGFTFGNSFGFNLTLSGPAIDSPGGTVGSAFALSLYAADGITPLLTTDPNGSVSTVYLNANGTALAEDFSSEPDGQHTRRLRHRRSRAIDIDDGSAFLVAAGRVDPFPQCSTETIRWQHHTLM